MTLSAHSSTNAFIKRAEQNDLPQSLLLSGASGVGLYTIAKVLGGNKIATVVVPEDKKGLPDPVSGTITVEIIRRLYEQTRTKQTSARVVIIDDAERMSRSAQSAFLKLLEEPGLHVRFILTSHAPHLLLATVRSRLQQFVVQPVSKEQSSAFLETLNIGDLTKKAQLQFIAGGLPAELTRLAENDEYFNQRAQIMGDARDFLQADAYKKLLVAQKYQADRAQSLRLIDSALLIGRRSLSAKPQPKLLHQLEQLLATRENIAANYSVRLQLAKFVV